MNAAFLSLSGVLALLSAMPPPCPENAARDDAAILARSLVDLGDTARLRHVLARARRGDSVVIGVIGGSITAGAGAGSPETAWGSLVAKWWRDTFPKADISFVNAGIGATGSDLGAHRVRKHLLEKKPDLVMVEYAVNDAAAPFAAETLEGLVRQILSQPNHPAVMLLFTMDNQGGNVQAEHAEIGRHYGLPMASFRDALWPEIEAGRMAWTDVEADEVHPNDCGHAWCARLLTDLCERTLKDLPEDGDPPGIAPIPGPKTANAFEKASFHGADTLSPSKNEGWAVFNDPAFGPFFGAGWKSDTPGSVLEFKVEGTAVSLLFYRVKGPMGIARAQVDDLPPVEMDGWFGAEWGGYTPFQIVARGLPTGPHTLRITLEGAKNPGSAGHEFRVHAVLLAE